MDHKPENVPGECDFCGAPELVSVNADSDDAVDSAGNAVKVGATVKQCRTCGTIQGKGRSDRKPDARAKRGASKRTAAKRSTAKRSTAKRGSAKRSSSKRGR